MHVPDGFIDAPVSIGALFLRAYERGERVALLGPNGAGKTTLVLHLNGILHGGTGTVRVGGLQVRPEDNRRTKGPCGRSAAGSGSSSKTRTTSCSCRP